MNFNRLVSVLMLVFCSALYLPGKSQTRHKVVSLVKQHQTDEWYQEQANLWGKYLEEHPQDGDAWLNYYTANRMLKIQARTVTQEELNELVKKIGKTIPNSFEYHYISYWNAGNSEAEKNFHHLEKAFELAPNRPETYDDFFTYYLLRDRQDKVKEVAEKWYKSNDISPGLYNWCYNMLMSCEKGAVLLTHGDNDTYPALILQQVLGLRTDVKVMNVHLLMIESYKKAAFKTAGIQPFNYTLEQAKAYFPYLDSLYNHMVEQGSRPVYLSLGTNKYFTDLYQDKLYNVGMAWKWSDKKFDNIAVMKKNYEKKFRLDYITNQFMNDISQGVVDHASANYLPSLLTLYNHYVESDDYKQYATKALIETIAEKADMKGQVSAALEETNRKRKSGKILEYKDFLEMFVEIDEHLYAMKTEVSNELYQLFLTDLVRQRRFQDLETAQIPVINWRSLLPNKLADLSDEEVFQNGHPDDPTSPVVNMSYDAALLFAEWMGDQYAQTEHRRKRDGSVSFALPTESEWERMALGGAEKRAYAWNGAYLRNSNGCFLANIDASKVDTKPVEECTSCNGYNLDGALFPVGVETYLPNEFGLYNLIGNVSEMIEEKGKSKGGSWNTPGGVATINHTFNYTEPNAETGFRLVMRF